MENNASQSGPAHSEPSSSGSQKAAQNKKIASSSASENAKQASDAPLQSGQILHRTSSKQKSTRRLSATTGLFKEIPDQSQKQRKPSASSSATTGLFKESSAHHNTSSNQAATPAQEKQKGHDFSPQSSEIPIASSQEQQEFEKLLHDDLSSLEGQKSSAIPKKASASSQKNKKPGDTSVLLKEELNELVSQNFPKITQNEFETKAKYEKLKKSGNTTRQLRAVSEPILEKIERRASTASLHKKQEQNEKAEAQKKQKKQRTPKSFLRHTKDFLVEVLKVLIVVLLLRSYVIQASTVEGNSMEPTLHSGDLLLVERFTPALLNAPFWLKEGFQLGESRLPLLPTSLLPTIEHGDIVVLRSPENSNNELVKRVVALSGDRIFFYEGKLYVNGKRREEVFITPASKLNLSGKAEEQSYVSADISDMPLAYRPNRADFELAQKQGKLSTLGVEIPENCFFVMGDNRRRAKSNDSRAWSAITIRNGPTGRDKTSSNHLWVTNRDIHGRVLARLRLPWEYDEEHPLFPK